jgi:hypothetical protein
MHIRLYDISVESLLAIILVIDCDVVSFDCVAQLQD